MHYFSDLIKIVKKLLMKRLEIGNWNSKMHSVIELT
jgi:hypothetical protein